ncbi:MAG: excinuclease ABC subunit C, partial [Desulfobacula sp.]|nr:excinuclease ABC subunit C [Desulfobacula sp.]
EAHRFAITFQRKRREKRAQLSVLDTIPGIGPKKKKVLLKHFKGITRMKTASIDEIAVLSGMNKPLAKALIQTLNAKD